MRASQENAHEARNLWRHREDRAPPRAARMEDAVRQTDLDWTLVRAPRLAEGPFTGKWRTVMPGEPRLTMRSLSFADLAGYMLQAAEDPKLVRTGPIPQVA